MAENSVKRGQENPSTESISEHSKAHALSEAGNVFHPTPNFNRLANLYWKYPTVHQEIYAYPLHVNHAFLAAAREKNERLKRELDKEPKPHRLSKEDPRIKNLKNSLSKKKSRNTISPSVGLRRTVNKSLVTNSKAKRMSVRRQTTFNRKPTISKPHKPAENDPGEALAEFRKVKGFTSFSSETGMGDTERSKSVISNTVEDQTPVILDAIRVQREDVEYNKRKARWSRKINKKMECCHTVKQCAMTNRCTCIAFFALVAIIICLAIVAIIYPVVRVLVMYEYE